jgi:hypothetical protein
MVAEVNVFTHFIHKENDVESHRNENIPEYHDIEGYCRPSETVIERWHD